MQFNAELKNKKIQMLKINFVRKIWEANKIQLIKLIVIIAFVAGFHHNGS